MHYYNFKSTLYLVMVVSKSCILFRSTMKLLSSRLGIVAARSRVKASSTVMILFPCGSLYNVIICIKKNGRQF